MATVLEGIGVDKRGKDTVSAVGSGVKGQGMLWGVKIEEVKGTLGVWLQMLWPRLEKTGGEAEMRQNIVC